MRRFGPMLFAVTLCFAACKRGVAPEASDAKIFGGDPVKPGDPMAAFTAALVIGDSVVCTATLVSPTVLVTAAHCLRDELVQSGLKVVFGLEASRGRAVPVRAYAVHPLYDPANKGSDTTAQNDLGLLAMAGPIEGLTPVPMIDPGVAFEAYSTTLKIAGYGLTDVGRGDAGTLRSATTTFSNDSKPTREIFVDGFRLANACAGDSGGPALLLKDGRIELLGVASFVIGVNGRLCTSGFASYSDVRAHRDWIVEMIQRLPQLTGKVTTGQITPAAAPGSEVVR